MTALFSAFAAESKGSETAPEAWQVRTRQNGESFSAWRPLPDGGLRLPREFQGYAEYKAHFRVPPPRPDDSFGIYLGQVGDADRVLINGMLVGQTGGFPPEYHPYLDLYREYLIPPNTLQAAQDNEIYVQTYVEYVGIKGIDPSAVKIGSHQKLQRRKYLDELSWYVFKLGVPGLCLILSLLSMPWISTRSQIRPNLLLVLTGLAYFIFGVGKSRVIFQILDPIPAYKLLTTSALFGLVCIFIYSLDLCRTRRKWPYVLAAGIPCVFAARIYSGSNLLDTSIYVKDWLVGSVPLLLAVSSSTLFLARDKSVWVRIGLACLTIVAINDVLNATRILDTGNIMDFGFSIFIISMLFSQMTAVKRGWVDLSKRESDLLWSTRFLKMASQVGHDIRSPLSSTQPALESLNATVRSSDFLGKEDALNSIEVIESGLQRMSSMSAKALSEYKAMFDKSETSEQTPTLRLTLLDKVLLDTIIESKAISPSHVTFKIHGFKSVPEVWSVVEVSEIQAAVSNILRNSIEALENTPSDAAIIQVSFEAGDNVVSLKIADQGSGIPPEALSRVFEEGFTYGKKTGTGLGLSQVRKAIELNEGSIALDSKLGSGTTVAITLPKEPTPKWFKKEIRLSKRRPVYFVDDDPSILAFWRDRMRSLANEQLRAAYHLSFKTLPSKGLEDAILVLDYEFKNEQLSSTDWLRRLSAIPETYLCTTSYDEPKVQEAVKALGIYLIPKPVIQGVSLKI